MIVPGLVVNAGRCDGSALRDLAACWPAPPQDYCAASVSRRRVSGSLREDCPRLRESLCKSSLVTLETGL
ncbi:MAG: hypothetical protein WCP70_09655 [Methanothrix sp.]